MFKKKICRGCGRSLKEKYSFCPYCGNTLETKKENRGMLGKNDLSNDSFFNGFGFPGVNFILNSLMKNMERQFNGNEKKSKPDKKGNISISISTFGDKMPVVKVNQIPNGFEMEKRAIKNVKFISSGNFSPEKLKKFSALPREEPKTNIRRLSNKVIYEVDLPGVRSAKDISILNLEKGIELKALSDKKAYLKSIPITLPILAYKLRKGKLVLELDAKDD